MAAAARQAAGKTQEQVARAAKMKQASHPARMTRSRRVHRGEPPATPQDMRAP